MKYTWFSSVLFTSISPVSRKGPGMLQALNYLWNKMKKIKYVYVCVCVCKYIYILRLSPRRGIYSWRSGMVERIFTVHLRTFKILKY